MLFRSIRLTPGDKGFRIEPPPKAGGLEGLYTRMDTGIRPNAFGGTDFYAEMKSLYFEKGGLFSRSPPDTNSLAEFCKKDFEQCGTYTLGGGWFSLHDIELVDANAEFGMFEREKVDFRRVGEALQISGDEWTKVAPVHGVRLDGTWGRFNASSGMTATSSGGVASWETFVFKKDGTFERSGGNSVSSSNTSADTTTSIAGGNDRPAIQGTYAIDAYTLTLTAADGTIEKRSFYATDPNDLDLLIINGSNFTRDKKG